MKRRRARGSAQRKRSGVGQRRGRTTTRKSRPGRDRTRSSGSHTPAVIPMLSYEDGSAALDWLARAFGFREVTRMLGPDGRLSHGEMTAGDGLIMLATPSPDYQSPKRHRENCAAARQWSTVPYIIDGVLVSVDDLDRHFARAKSAGATILSEIEEGPPGRRYRAEDLEGHRWFFFEK